MDFTELIFGGIGGAIVSAGVAYYIYVKSKRPPTGKAYVILKGLGKILEEPEGEYYFTRSADDNFHVANHIYSHADSRIIATAFNEDPSTYGDGDLARGFTYGGSLFRRITSRDVCSPDSETRARQSLTDMLEGASLIVLPTDAHVTKIDGIFCRFNDNTHLCFIAFREPSALAKNKGVIFRDGVAKSFFEYYEELIEKYANS